MVALKSGGLYLFSSEEEPYEDAFGVFECMDGGYVFLKVLFWGHGLERDCWLPDGYRIVRQATLQESDLFMEVVVRVSGDLGLLRDAYPGAAKLQRILDELFFHSVADKSGMIIQ